LDLHFGYSIDDYLFKIVLESLKEIEINFSHDLLSCFESNNQFKSIGAWEIIKNI
jgi:hypothetical protein